MTKQDFIRIARALYNSRPAPIGDGFNYSIKSAHHRIVVAHIMRELASSNPRFDRDKFLKAIYPIPEDS